mgnify:CR=1 FL=1
MQGLPREVSDRPELQPAQRRRRMPRRARYNSTDDHFRNFFDAVRTRRPVVEDAVFGLRAAGPALLANHSLLRRTGRLVGMPKDDRREVAPRITADSVRA